MKILLILKLILTNNSLVVGDLIHHNAHAWLEGGIINNSPKINLKAWINLLNDLQNDFDKKSIVYAGRGISTRLDFAVNKQMAYLKKAGQIVKKYISKVPRSEFSNTKASKHYKEISKVFKKAFPEYKLSYMVEYGVYGLVNMML